MAEDKFPYRIHGRLRGTTVFHQSIQVEPKIFVIVHGSTREATERRAKLMVAAPRMLAALKKARTAIATWSPAPVEPLEEIDDLIAEIEGR